MQKRHLYEFYQGECLGSPHTSYSGERIGTTLKWGGRGRIIHSILNNSMLTPPIKIYKLSKLQYKNQIQFYKTIFKWVFFISSLSTFCLQVCSLFALSICISIMMYYLVFASQSVINPHGFPVQIAYVASEIQTQDNLLRYFSIVLSVIVKYIKSVNNMVKKTLFYFQQLYFLVFSHGNNITTTKLNNCNK